MMVDHQDICTCAAKIVFQDDAHVHSPPKYQLYAVHMCNSVKVVESDTIKLLDES